MRDYIDIGSSPPGESCAQLGADGYWEQAKRECSEYIRHLRRVFGPEPDGARLAIMRNEHDFGTYLSVVCHYDDTIEASMTYAFRCESEGPEFWDADALKQLHIHERNRP
jgi:hypothetical protein